jgi:hypothetical protein
VDHSSDDVIKFEIIGYKTPKPVFHIVDDPVLNRSAPVAPKSDWRGLLREHINRASVERYSFKAGPNGHFAIEDLSRGVSIEDIHRLFREIEEGNIESGD